MANKAASHAAPGHGSVTGAVPAQVPRQVGIGTLSALHSKFGNAAVSRLLRPVVEGRGTGREPPGFEATARGVIRLLAGEGRPLDPQVRAAMEAAFGVWFGSVRVHVDDVAAESARGLDARAFTVGDHVAFSRGVYEPSTPEGRRLIAHELAHVVQQRRGGADVPSPFEKGPSEDAARQAAIDFLAGKHVEVTGSSPIAIAREDGGSSPDDAETYARLRELESSAEGRTKDLQKQMSKYEGSKVTVGVGYAVDSDGILRRIVSTSSGKETAIFRQPDEVWAPHDPKAPAVVKRKGVRGDDRTAQEAAFDAEANIVALARDRGWKLITAGASWTICKHCTARIRTAGGTTSSETRGKAEVGRYDLQDALKELKRAKPAPAKVDPAIEKAVPKERLGPRPGAEWSQDPNQRVKRGSFSRSARAEAASGRPAVAVEQPSPRRSRGRKVEGGNAEAQVPPREVEETPIGPGVVRRRPLAPAAPGPEAAAVEAEKPPGVVTGAAPKAGQAPTLAAPAPPAKPTAAAARGPSVAPPKAAPAEPVTERDIELKPEAIESTTKRKLESAAGTTTVKKTAAIGGEGAAITRETTQEAGEKSSLQRTKRSIGAGGVTAETTRRQTERGVGTEAKRKVAVKPGEVSLTREESSGEFDETGKLRKGTTKTSQLSAGAHIGESGAGASAKVGRESVTQHAGGARTGKSAHFQGRVNVDVEQIPGKVPPKYRAVATVNLAGDIGVSAGAGGKSASGTASVTASGEVSATFVHVLPEDEVNAYRASVENPAAAPASKETALLALIQQGKLGEAQAILAEIRAGPLSAEGIKAMKPGDSVEFTIAGTLGGAVDASAQGAVVGAKVRGGVTGSRSLHLRIDRTDKQAVVTVRAVGERGYTAGGGATIAGASGEYTHEKSTATGQGATFTLDVQDPAFDRQLQSIRSARSVDDLNALVSSGTIKVASTTESNLVRTTDKPAVGFLGLGLEGTDTTIRGEERTRESTGEGSVSYLGGRATGLHVTADKTRLGYEREDLLRTTVASTGQAELEATKTETETDIGGSVQKLAQGIEEHPALTAAGLATGATPVLRTRTELIGVKVSDRDFDTIVALASDKSAWETAFGRAGILIRNLEDAEALRLEVAGSGGDREVIAKAFQDFGSRAPNSADFVRYLLRPRGATEGGIQFDWPPELVGFKPVFDDLVEGDPVAKAKQKSGPGDFEGALSDLTEQTDKLDVLFKQIDGHPESFREPAVRAEMERRILRRRSEIRNEIRALRKALAPSEATEPRTATKPRAARPQTAEQLAETEEEQKDRADRLNEALRICLDLRVDETRILGEIEADYHHWYGIDYVDQAKKFDELRSQIYPQWDKAVKELTAVFEERGEANPEQHARGYGPNQAEFARAYAKWHK